MLIGGARLEWKVDLISPNLVEFEWVSLLDESHLVRPYDLLLVRALLDGCRLVAYAGAASQPDGSYQGVLLKIRKRARLVDPWRLALDSAKPRQSLWEVPDLSREVSESCGPICIISNRDLLDLSRPWLNWLRFWALSPQSRALSAYAAPQGYSLVVVICRLFSLSGNTNHSHNNSNSNPLDSSPPASRRARVRLGLSARWEWGEFKWLV